jgi:hypothetical protein
MKWPFLPVAILKKTAIAGVCLATYACCQPAAVGQRVGGHVGGGVRVSVPPRPVARPPVVRAPITRPIVPGGMPHGFGRPLGPFGFRHPFFFGPPFFGPPFFGYGANLAFDSVFWLTCGPFWGWEPGCGSVPTFEGYGTYPNYVLAPQYQQPVYVYGSEQRDLVRIFLKDGTVFNVSDYWFVNGQVHFVAEEEGEQPIEQALGMDEVDWQRTIDVNTRRGFRLVMRDEPWEQYLRDHPNETPPLVQPPKNP